MTKVTLKKVGFCRYLVKSEGHATGSTEACAATSMLCYMLFGYLERTGAKVYKQVDEDGYMEIEFRGNRKLYDLIRTGYTMLHEAYSEYVNVQLE